MSCPRKPGSPQDITYIQMYWCSSDKHATIVFYAIQWQVTYAMISA